MGRDQDAPVEHFAEHESRLTRSWGPDVWLCNDALALASLSAVAFARRGTAWTRHGPGRGGGRRWG